jgi:hypothetical protein
MARVVPFHRMSEKDAPRAVGLGIVTLPQAIPHKPHTRW